MGRAGDLRPARERRMARASAEMALSCEITRLCSSPSTRSSFCVSSSLMLVTGTPVRPEIAAVSRSPAARRRARRALGLLEDRVTIGVFGGSLGARRINDAIGGLVARWRDGRDDLSMYHIVGRRDWQACMAGTSEQATGDGGGSGLRLVQVPYEERMDMVYTASDLVVCRAGAMTVAELAAAGVPSVLVPLPGAPGDHQTANARVLERAGASVLLPDGECEPESLARCLDRLLGDPTRLEAMERAAASMGRPDAAAAGARVVEASARPPTGGRQR